MSTDFLNNLSDDEQGLLANWLTNSLTPESQKALDKLLEKKPRLVSLLADFIEEEGLLRIAHIHQSTFRDQVMAALPTDNEQFTQHVIQQMQAHPSLRLNRIRRRTGSSFGRWISIAAGIAALIVCAVIIGQKRETFDSPTPVAWVTTGPIKSDGNIVEVNAPIFKESAVDCGRGSLIRFADGSTVLCSRPSRIYCAENGAVLDSGSISCAVAHQPEGLHFTIRTLHALVSVIGTQFTVSSGSDRTEVNVDHGRVAVTGRVGDSIELGAGDRATVRMGASAEREPNSAIAHVPSTPVPSAPKPPIVAPPVPVTADVETSNNTISLHKLSQQGFTLLDGTTKEVIVGYERLQQRQKIKLSTLSKGGVDIAASFIGDPGSVLITVNGEAFAGAVAQDNPPFTYTGGLFLGKECPPVSIWHPSPGHVRIQAIPYMQANFKGPPGAAMQIDIEFVP